MLGRGGAEFSARAKAEAKSSRAKTDRSVFKRGNDKVEGEEGKGRSLRDCWHLEYQREFKLGETGSNAEVTECPP